MLYQRFGKSQQRSRLHSPTGLFILLLALFVGLGLAATHVMPAYAVCITVDSVADTVATDGACTLREAIDNANADADTTGGDCAAGAGDDTITFGVSGTIAAGAQQYTIENNGKLTIDGGGAITVNRSFSVKAGANATLAGLNISNSGVYNDGGTLTVSRSTIDGALTSAASGAGIFNNNGILIVRDSTLEQQLCGGWWRRHLLQRWQRHDHQQHLLRQLGGR
ncbi:MAG: CSLREA domain-containing protein [Caldilineaceae bacterium]